MALPSRFWPFWGLLCFCLCFPPQEGGGAAFDPLTSRQPHAGGSPEVEADPDAGAAKPVNRKSFAPLQVPHKNSDLGEENGSGNSPGQSSKPPKPTYLHPLPLLIKQTQKESVEDLSFPTVRYFKQFVEAMKNSYLTPGSDPSRYFQTARGVLENELALNAPEGQGPARSEGNSGGTSGPSAAPGPPSEGRGSLETGLSHGAGSRSTHPVSRGLTELMPSGSFLGEPPPAEAPISPAHGPAPDLDPKTSERMSQESDSQDSFKYENPSGGSRRKDPRVKYPADVPRSPHAGRWKVWGRAPGQRGSLSSSASGEDPKGPRRPAVGPPPSADLSPRGQSGVRSSVPERAAFAGRQLPRSPNAVLGVRERWVSSPYRVGYSLNFLADLSLPPAPDGAFWRNWANSRSSNAKTLVFDHPEALGSFHRFAGPAEAAVPRVPTRGSGAFRWPPGPLYAPNGGFWRSGARRGLYYDGRPLPRHIARTRGSYLRRKASLLKTRHAPHQAGLRPWNPAPTYPRWRKAEM